LLKKIFEWREMKPTFCNNRRRFSTAEDLFSLNERKRFNVVVVKRLRLKRSFSLKRLDDERNVKLIVI